MDNIEKYGMEVIVDLHGCNIKKFTKKSLDIFFSKLCILSDMTPVGKPKYWHEISDLPHLSGRSGIQFIKTSNILIHTLDLTNDTYINFFSCKDFNVDEVSNFIKDYFEAERIYLITVFRGSNK